MITREQIKEARIKRGNFTLMGQGQIYPILDIWPHYKEGVSLVMEDFEKLYQKCWGAEIYLKYVQENWRYDMLLILPEEQIYMETIHSWGRVRDHMRSAQNPHNLQVMIREAVTSWRHWYYLSTGEYLLHGRVAGLKQLL